MDDDVLKRAWSYYRRNGWQRSMKMLRRKINGSAPVPPVTYLTAFNSIAETGASAMRSRPELPRFEMAEKAAAIFPHGVVAIIGDLNLPQCKKYRVIQKLETLKSIGLQADYSFWGDMPRSLNIMQCASSVIFYRMKENHAFNAYLAEARRLGIPAGYDIDDPIFDKGVYGSNPNLEFLTADERASLLSETESYRRAMLRCDFVITSTPAMKDLASQSSRFVYVWRNAVDAETRHWAEVARATKPQETDGIVVLGYASGSRAHEADFRLIERPLLAIFDRFDNARLAISGYLNLPQSFAAHASRIVEVPFTSYGGYLASMAQIDINIVPLLPDRFNECKSAIRFLDAAVVGVPTIASRVGDFANVIHADRTGVLADGEEEWIERLSDVISGDTLRHRMAMEARHSALTEYSTDVIAHGLDAELQTRLRRSDP